MHIKFENAPIVDVSLLTIDGKGLWLFRKGTRILKFNQNPLYTDNFGRMIALN